MPYQHHPSVVVTPVTPNETVLLHLDSQRYFTVNSSGSLIWDALGEGLDETAIIERLTRRFEVSAEAASKSVQRLVTSLLQKELLIEHRSG
ncbi:MAG: PqqD family protein [Deltaproteobacteria bacterium]|nr:PqqD family protein [Deltaproteobacteria bacterium]